MKTRLLTILMMLAMLAGADVAKADTVTATATFDSSVWGTTDKSFNGSATDTWTSSGVTMAITGDDTYNSSISSGYFYVYYPGNLTFTVPTGCTLTGLTITGSGDAVSASTGTMTANATSGGYTWSGSASTLTLTPGTAGRNYYRFESIVVTYEADLGALTTTTSTGATYDFTTNATSFVDASLQAKTITAGIQEMYLDGFSATTDPMITRSPTNGATYLHMPAGSRLRLQRSESGSGVYVTRAVFTYASGTPNVEADGGEYDSSTGVWTGRESQVIFLFNDDADIQLVQAEAAAYASVRVSTQGRGQTAVDGTNISLESDPNGNPTGTTTVYVKVGGSLALTMTPDDARHELSTASYTESYWDAEDNYHSDDTDFLAEGKANGSYTMSNIQHDCSVSIVYSWITHLISYHASGNGTINLVATYLDDDGTSMSYDQAEQMYGGEAARDNTEDRKISIGTGGTVNMIMTADTGYKLSSLMVNDVEMVNSENLTKDGSVYTYTITPLTAAQTISATFANDTPEAYAALSEDGSGNLVLTFYYDTNKGDDDYVVEPFANYGSRGWDGRSGNITSVVFDDTFANYSPTSTAYWFYGMTSLTSVSGLEWLSTDAVTTMSSMFERCSALTTLDLSNFQTSRVTNMANMFAYCSNLSTIFVGSGWSTEAVQYSANMFVQCTSLAGGKGTTVTSTGADYARIDGGTSNPGYLTDVDAPRIFNVNVKIVGIGNVTATYSSNQTFIYSNSDNDISVARGEAVILAITPNTGYALGSVMLDTLDVTSQVAADSTGVLTYTLKVYDTHNITVTFVNDTDEPYAVLAGNTLTFYYDKQKEARQGMDIGPFSTSGERGWDSQKESITRVVFDESFANCTTITSTADWFVDMSNLATIEGIQYLKTDNVTDMNWMFGGCANLSSVELGGFNTEKVTNMSYMFANCTGLQSVDLSGFNAANVTDMTAMFTDCTLLANVSFGNSFNAGEVTTMHGMFAHCSSLRSLDLSGFRTEKISTMNSMFQGCTTLENINFGNFNTPALTDIGGLFQDCTSLRTIDLSSFNTANVYLFSGMFSNCSALTTIYVGANWSTSGIDPNNVMLAYSIFDGCTNLKGGAGTVYDETHTDYTYAHIDGGASNPGYLTDVNAPDSYNIKVTVSGNGSVAVGQTTISSNSEGEVSVDRGESLILAITPDTGYALSSVIIDDTLNVTSEVIADSTGVSYYTLARVYDEHAVTVTFVNNTLEAYAVLSNDSTQVLSQGATGIVYAKKLTFYYDTYKESRDGMDIGPFEAASDRPWTNNTSDIMSVVFDDSFASCTSLTSTAFWFYQCSRLQTITGIENLKTDNVTNMSWMFQGCSALTSLDLTNFNTEKVTDMSYMFDSCTGLTSLDLSNFNTANVTNMEFMISGLTSLTSFVNNFNTENVTNMNAMFASSTSLTSLDLSSFNTARVANMDTMFYGCNNLQTIYVGSDWTTANVTSSADMFTACNSLVGGLGTTYDANHTDRTYARIDGGTSAPGYFTDKNATIWSVIGTINGNWDTDTRMESTDGVNYTAKFTGMNIGSYQFKIRANGGWDIQYPNNGDSSDGGSEPASVAVELEDQSTITVMFNAETGAITTDVTGVYSVPGSYNSWVIDSEEMIKGSDGIYSLTIDSLTAGTTYEYKIAVAHSWDINYGVGGQRNGDNLTFTVPDGETSVTVYFNPVSKLATTMQPTGIVQPYALLSGDNTTLTFYYDDLKEWRQGMDVGPFAHYSNRPWQSAAESITTATFDDSFAQCDTLRSIAWWLYELTNLTQVSGMENLKTDNVTDMSHFLSVSWSLPSIDLSHLNTANVTNMEGMFASCWALTSLDVSNFNTEKVTNMAGMFNGLTGIRTLDIRNFNTANVTNMQGMFGSNPDLTTIYAGDGWSTSAITGDGGSGLFTGCTSLVGGRGTAYDADHVDADYARIDMAPDAPGYFTRTVVMGDANDDGSVTIADAVATVTNILGETAEGYFSQAKADMNGDSEIDIFDVTLIVNAVLAASPAPAYNGMTSAAFGSIAAEDVRMEAQANSLTMGISGSEEYTAFQFDVTLPEGTTLEGVRLASAATNHQLAFQKVSGNTYRVVGLSMTNQQLCAAGGRLVQLQLSGHADESNVTMSNVLFVGQPATDATAIRNHITDGAADAGAIYDLNGRYVGNDRRQLSKGIYIINHKKVNIK